MQKSHITYHTPVSTRYGYDMFFEVPLLHSFLLFGGIRHTMEKIIEIRKNLCDLTGPWVGYHNKVDTNMETLKRKTEQLNDRNNDTNEQVNYAVQRSRKRRRDEVKHWQEEARRIADKVQTLERQVQEVSWMIVFKRAKLGKLVVETVEKVGKLYEDGEFSNGFLIDDPICGHAIPIAESLAETTSVRNKEKIWNFLMDDAVRKIGVHEMEGVGKTTIMKHINNQLLDETCYFDDVIWVTVSKAFEIKNLQRQIAKKLKLELSDYEDELCLVSKTHNMLSQKKYVLILDDLWKAFPLEEVGIPEPTTGNRFKLVLTTRSLEVCTKMNCITVEMELLIEEEALNLFMNSVEGHQTVLTPEVKEIAEEVAKKCACLPLAIITMAGSMREEKNIHVWRNAINASQLMDKDERLFEQLKFSYSQLKDEHEQHCFLYCALYREDADIYKKELIEYWIAEDLIHETNNRDAMFDEGHTILNKLIKTYLLVECEIYGVECVKMHDLIREMALKVTSTSGRFMVRAGEGLKRVSHKDWSEDLQRVSLMWNDIKELPSKPPIFPRLTTFLLNDNQSKVLQIPDSFFLHMPRLKVLNLSYTAIESLPNSISMLENLHQLLLRHCYKLKYVSSLEKLKALEHFELTRSQIEEVPQGIEELVNLRKLELSDNDILGMSSCRKLCRLTQLHYLRIQTTKVKVSVEELFLEVGVVDKEKLTCVYNSEYLLSNGVDAVVIGSGIEDLRIRRWDNYISLSDIQLLRDARDYHIPLTTIEELSFVELPNFRVLFDRVVPPHNISFKLKRLEFCECPKIKNIFSALLLHNFPNLEELQVLYCENVEEIIVEVERSDRGGHREDDGNTITLPNLKKLCLEDLPRLNSIYKGIMVCESLQQIGIWWCPMLRRLPISLHMNEDGEQASAPPAFRSISGSTEWWESLKWDNPLTKTTLQPFFPRII
ncbi:hypothetical protein TEA_029376 [Camellia sinensis var. sinensis]|uniref:Uncharacterized protein n=1 Tax=Camellia sinensis var. sinensis TaxID=542762 RepID=A0A4S4DX99_CAMSN|nr:hypothetical protein TEA_029376 [Camellia sinensis var. sinensis]